MHIMDNHCTILFNSSTELWEGVHNGQVLATAPDLDVVCAEMSSRGFIVQDIDAPSLLKSYNSLSHYLEMLQSYGAD